jgi:D-aminopeptidase
MKSTNISLITAFAAIIFTSMTMLSNGLCAQGPEPRKRSAELGLHVGVLEPGPLNAITDVQGVLVGHTTRLEGEDIRTGVTAILPHGGNLFQQKVPAAIHCYNGFGKLAGYLQVRELGNIEAPIVLTNTLNVGTAVDAVVKYVLSSDGNESVRSVNAVVGETNDGYLNDIRGQHITRQDVEQAIRSAASGVVEEGTVGAGTGTMAFGYKGGIGTASRQTPAIDGKQYTVGVLVQTNFGRSLVINGIPFTRAMEREQLEMERKERIREDRDQGDMGQMHLESPGTGGPNAYGAVPELAHEEFPGEVEEGSCMIVIATDAPLCARNLDRLARRSFTGMGRTTTVMTNGSGDFAIAFSTAWTIPHEGLQMPGDLPPLLSNNAMNGLFQAVEEATQDAVYNSLLMATPVTGQGGRGGEAIPVDEVIRLLKEYNMFKYNDRLPR